MQLYYCLYNLIVDRAAFSGLSSQQNGYRDDDCKQITNYGIAFSVFNIHTKSICISGNIDGYKIYKRSRRNGVHV